MTEKIKLGDKLANLRKSMGLKRPEMGERIGIGYQTLYKYETNQRMPDPAVINRLAHFFGVTTDYLIGDGDQASHWANQRIDVRRLCDDVDLYLNGDPMSEENKEKLRLAIRILFPYK